MIGYGEVPVVVSDQLPTLPSFGEDIVRRVRHGLEDVLEWCGEDVGPEPGEPTHAYVSIDLAFGSQPTVFVSREEFDRLTAYAAEQVPTMRLVL